MFDVITIGSATVDAFAETEQRYIKEKAYHYPIGAKIQIERMNFDIGGGGTNTAVSFSRLGLKTGWIGIVGKGHNGDRILKMMKDENVNTEMVHRSSSGTGFSVILDAKGHDRTILAYKGSNDELSASHIKLRKLQTKWIYASSLMGKSFNVLKEIFAYAHKNNVRTAFNPSLYLVKEGKKKLGPILSKTDVLVYNKEEAQELTGKKEIRDLLIHSQKLLKQNAIVVVTDGPNGAFAFDGFYEYKIVPHKVKVVETTGAGDAFASTFVAMLIRGKDIYFAMKAAILNSESVIQHIGAKNKLLTWNEMIAEMKKCKSRVEIDRII